MPHDPAYNYATKERMAGGGVMLYHCIHCAEFLSAGRRPFAGHHTLEDCIEELRRQIAVLSAKLENGTTRTGGHDG